MAPRLRQRKSVPQRNHQDVGTQTSPEKVSVENTQLKEELHLLKQELLQLKHLQLNDEAVEPKQNKIVEKGCNCKGKCATKSCGCVKKQLPCRDICNCSDLKCSNQKHNKENIDDVNSKFRLSKDSKHIQDCLSILKQRTNLPGKATDEIADPSSKRLDQVRKSKKSFFSPDTPPTDEYRLSLTQLELNVSLEFGDSKKTLDFASNSFMSPTSRELELSVIDPMKPTRQLPRTPIDTSLENNQTQISTASFSFPIKQEEIKPVIVPPPEDINEPIVNWEKHNAQLVPCRLCNRKFYPFRLEKHESSCKKI